MFLNNKKTFIRRNTDENNKRNNYLVDKFTMKKRTKFVIKNYFPSQTSFLFRSSKENIMIPKLISPKKKTPTEIIDDDDDFISIKKPPKTLNQPLIKVDPIKECLESIISEIENNDTTCPICNQLFSNLNSIDQRQQHVNRCLEDSQINNVFQTQISYLMMLNSHLD